jgi:CDP-diacylglycerol--glycerol-3-phosphate 3-phosphatidyltransferase
MGLANRITVTRGAMSIALWSLLHVIDLRREPPGGLWWAAFALFVVTAATDSLDGYIARRRNEVSVFGRIADPFVDKLLVLGSMIFLIGLPGMAWVVPPWTVAVVLARELLVTALRGAVEGAGGNFQAGPWGKAKMTAQCIAIGAALLHGAGVAFVRCPLAAFSFAGDDAVPPQWCLARLIAVLSAVMTAASGVEYALRALRALRAVGRRA